MRCPSCQTDNPETSKFCRECGTRLSLACASCGTPLAAGSKFCPECGAAQADASAAASVAAPAPPAPTAERRLVSVLFADLVGFTTLAEARDAEDTRELLDRYFAAAREIVGRYGGTIEKFIGDAVMAVWGTPVAQEDDAERAVRAALDLVTRVTQLGGELGSAELALRGGVLTGEAAVTIGAEGQGMVAGDLVNTAARLQSAADPGTVLVGDATRRATEGAIAYEPAGERDLKGKSLPVAAFRAVRVIALRGGEGGSGALEPPFVGRDAELRMLKDLLHGTGEERRPRLVAVLGQAGIGKSRLAWELEKYIDGVTEDIYWHRGRSPAYGEGVAFWALGEMVRSRAGIAEGEDDASSRAKLAAALETYVPDGAERARIAPALEALLGLAEDDSPAAQGSETLFAAWRTFFERVSDAGTVAMVFEDLHWADPGLLDFLEHVLDWSRGHPILMIALARPELLERRSAWGLARRNLVSLPLEPLGETAMGTLLDGLVEDLPAPTRAAIIERSAGIPLYAVEMIRMLVDDGRITAADGTLRPTGDLGELTVPESLHALVASRLDALEPADRALLQAGSVLGKSFAVDTLAAVADREPGEVEGRLRDLVRRELLVVDVDSRSPERGQYAFVQALVREVAHSTLARRERRRLHLAAARHLETLDDPEIAGVLATHYGDAYEAQPDGPEGEALAAQARVALRAAADRAARLGSYLHAHRYLAQALEVTRAPAERADLLEAAALAAVQGAEMGGAVAGLQEAVDLRRQLGDRSRVLLAIAYFVRAHMFAADTEEGLRVALAAADEFADLAETAEFVTLGAELTRGLMRTGKDADCVAWADRILPVAERHGVLVDTLEVLINKGTSLQSLGRLREAQAILLGVIELARLHELPAIEVRASINITFVVEAEDPRLSRSQSALELVRRYGLRGFLVYLVSNRMEELVVSGAWDEGMALAEEWAESAGSEEERDRMAGLSVDIRAMRGEIDAAALESMYTIYRRADDPQIEAAFQLSLARGALGAADVAETYRRSMRALEVHAVSVALSALALASHAALRLRDPELARRAREILAVRPGRMADLLQRAVDAGIAALEGRTTEALDGFREALRSWRELGTHLDAALLGMAMLAVVPRSVAPLDDVAADVRGALETMGAPNLVAQLDAILAERAAAPAPTTRAAAEAESRIGS